MARAHPGGEGDGQRAAVQQPAKASQDGALALRGAAGGRGVLDDAVGEA